jgi:hypothetical protein
LFTMYLKSDNMRPAECKRTLHHVCLDGLTLVPVPVALSAALKKHIVMKLWYRRVTAVENMGMRYDVRVIPETLTS